MDINEALRRVLKAAIVADGLIRGIRESVKHGVTGYLVPHGDTAAMAAYMHQLGNDRAQVEQLGVRARQFAEGFTWEHAARETERHLREVVHEVLHGEAGPT